MRFVQPGMICSLDLNFSFLPTMFLPAAPNMDFFGCLVHHGITTSFRPMDSLYIQQKN